MNYCFTLNFFIEMKKYIVTEVKAAFDGIVNLPQKENLSLEDIQQSLPNILAGTSYEADTYEVISTGILRLKRSFLSILMKIRSSAFLRLPLIRSSVCLRLTENAFW